MDLLGRRDESAPCAHVVAAVAHLDADRVPAAVLHAGATRSRGRYCFDNSSAMPAVAGSRSRAVRTISVRPPLSSVMSRSAATLTRSSGLIASMLRAVTVGGGHRRHSAGNRGPGSAAAAVRVGRLAAARESGTAAGSAALHQRLPTMPPRRAPTSSQRLGRRSSARRCRSRRPALRSRGSAPSAPGRPCGCSCRCRRR